MNELPDGWTPLRNKAGEIVLGVQGDMIWIIATGEIVYFEQQIAQKQDMRAVEQMMKQ